MPRTSTTRYVLTIDLPIEDAHLAPEFVRRDLARRAYEAGLRGDRHLARIYSAAAVPLGCTHPPDAVARDRRGDDLVEFCVLCGTLRRPSRETLGSERRTGA